MSRRATLNDRIVPSEAKSVSRRRAETHCRTSQRDWNPSHGRERLRCALEGWRRPLGARRFFLGPVEAHRDPEWSLWRREPVGFLALARRFVAPAGQCVLVSDDVQPGLLVANPENRYLLNSTMLPQFARDADGGLARREVQSVTAPTFQPAAFGFAHRFSVQGYLSPRAFCCLEDHRHRDMATQRANVHRIDSTRTDANAATTKTITSNALLDTMTPTIYHSTIWLNQQRHWT